MKEPAQLRPGRWQTLPAEVTVSVVVHTPVSGMRMLDYVALLEPDPRIRLEWTIAPDRFSTGAEQLLDRHRVPVVPWADALDRPYDLAITTSLHQVEFLHAKRKFAAPHGCGYGKRYPSWAWPANEDPPVYGLDRESLLDRDGRPVFDAILLPHLADLQVLLRQCPEVARTAVIGGDLAFDRLMAARPYRERYRLDLGVRRRQTLVALGSTWGGESLLAKSRELPTRLLHELTADHRVIMTMHPAAWYEHGPRQIRAWMRDAHEAGLDFIGPGYDWRPLLAAADVFIGDHTSLTSYAAASGPHVLRRRLRGEPRRLREVAGLLQKDVADALEWSVSKVIRIETGAVGISKTELLMWLRHCGVNDQARIDELLAVWRDGECAVASMTSYDSTCPFDRFVRARLPEHGAPPELPFVLDEAVIRRRVGPSPKRLSGRYGTPRSRPRGMALTPGLADVTVDHNAAATVALDKPLTALVEAEQTLVDAGFDSQPLEPMLANLVELERRLVANGQTTDREVVVRVMPHLGPRIAMTARHSPADVDMAANAFRLAAYQTHLIAA